MKHDKNKPRAKNGKYDEGMMEVITHHYTQGVQILKIVELLNELGFKSQYGKALHPWGVRDLLKKEGIFINHRQVIKAPPKAPTYNKPIEPIVTRATCKGDYVAFCTTSRKPLMRAEKMKDIDLFIQAKKQAI